MRTVFKSDVDVLLGPDVLATAAELGRDRMCLFACLSTGPNTAYPERFREATDFIDFIRRCPSLAPMPTEGMHAYPRAWFEEIGGFDLQFEGWGFEDSDLRERAKGSIGIVQVKDVVLVHQWHERSIATEEAARNRAYYEQRKRSPAVVRNGGKLVPSSSRGTASASTGQNAILIPRVFHHIWVGPNPRPENAERYRASWEKAHPGWEFRFWTDANLPPLRNAHIFEHTREYAQKADLLRHELLCQFGGVYLDVDFECLQNIEPLLANVSYFYADQRPGQPNIAIMGSIPGHPFTHCCLERLPELWPWRRGHILEETGPDFYRRAIVAYIGRAEHVPCFDPRSGRAVGTQLIPRNQPALWAFHPWAFYPYFLHQPWNRADHPDAYAVHHWEKNWE